jgi:hypothetical protein
MSCNIGRSPTIRGSGRHSFDDLDHPVIRELGPPDHPSDERSGHCKLQHELGFCQGLRRLHHNRPIDPVAGEKRLWIVRAKVAG